MQWRLYWPCHKGDSLTYNALGASLSAREMKTYSSLEVLQILTTRPVTTATNEAFVWCSEYLKIYLRSTLKEACLNGFALLYVRRDPNINVESVIDEFLCKNCRLNFK